jgi:glucose/arabinose dehydrogenase
MTRPLPNPIRLNTLVVISLLFAALGALSNPNAGDPAKVSETLSFDLTPVVARGLESPLFLTHAGDGSGHLFIVEQPGTIRLVVQGVLQDKPFLDIKERVLSGGERGLLGLAFHPDYRRNGRFFVNYTRQQDGATVLAEYHRAGSPLQASPDERVIMTVPQPFANHNGGMVVFGPDGFLYIGRGDGGSRGDPQNRAQNTQELLGKILRLDVDHGQPYAIPTDNPFARSGGRPEIFAYGIRNPWRFSFDRETKVLWLADVGQYKWEEIDLVTKGGNYGWRAMEGFHCYEPAEHCPARGMTMPVFEYGHEKGRCSITGGYVYRGKMIPSLRGIYFFGDYCSGELFGIKTEGTTLLRSEPDLLRKTGSRISSFGEDEAGELYVVDHGGAVFRISPSSP